MPAPNDLTLEEEAEFAQHGVPPAGPGREPLSEAPPEQQAAQQQTEQHQPAEGEQGQQTFHRENGQFASREERQQGQARPGQQQGQEQQGQPPAEGEQGQPPAEEGEQRTVPLAALHQSRLREQQFARRTQLAEARLNAILARQQEQQPEEQMPDIGEDPAGYILALEQRLQRFEQDRTENIRTQQIDTAISTDEDTFTQITPDYPQASDYFVQSRAQELLQFHTPQEAQKLMLQEARQIAAKAWERGQSVGEVIYGLAQARGYNPGMPPREPYRQPQGQQQQQQGQQQRGPRATDVVDSITRGQQASRSLSSGSGASPESLNASAILDMDDVEFNRWLGEGSEATKRFASIG